MRPRMKRWIMARIVIDERKVWTAALGTEFGVRYEQNPHD